MRVVISVRKDLYQDLEVLAKIQNCSVPTVIRSFLNEQTFKDTVHGLAITGQALMQGQEELQNFKAKMEQIESVKR